MKKLMLISILFLCCQYLIGQNKIELYNNTDKDVYASYAYYDYQNKCWSTKGWYKILPYSPKIIELGNYTNDIYIYGESTIPGTFWLAERKISWGNEVQFCIDPSNSFEIRYADKINCTTKKSFSKKNIVKGLNKWTFSN